MINQSDIISFFNQCAPSWDENAFLDHDKINLILNNAGVNKGRRILDVACGTGILIPEYLKRNVSSVTAVDISPEMLSIARRNYALENICFICNDVQAVTFKDKFDSIVIYNAFPHFPDPSGLISYLSNQLAPGGFLTVAHGSSRKNINSHHNDVASRISIELPDADELAELFSAYLNVTTVISNDEMYQVAGRSPI